MAAGAALGPLDRKLPGVLDRLRLAPDGRRLVRLDGEDGGDPGLVLRAEARAADGQRHRPEFVDLDRRVEGAAVRTSSRGWSHTVCPGARVSLYASGYCPEGVTVAPRRALPTKEQHLDPRVEVKGRRRMAHVEPHMSRQQATEQHDLLIDADRVAPSTGEYAPTSDPATGGAFATVAVAGPDDVDDAVAAAASMTRWPVVTLPVKVMVSTPS